ncbi:hypothetical protein HUO13_06470 [Saccharopolyspora erythraea]|uniref:hypothetical protein n=1 Tax=Saccharopolyspora erythraea TaxID=1836 RepID=UPI001BA5DA7B|nr:hypothetical protein [Saccharopolyspora erythraea]QUH00509.1 hypothetical protein HUO13_06470 [Saccharopolyspora erythraea]
MDLLVLSFVAGFALATLIFWPMLQRAQRQPGTSAKRATTSCSATRLDHAGAEPPKPDPVVVAGPGHETGLDPEAVAESAVPQRREPEPVEMPSLPTDLFAQRYQARFNRSRGRLERLRAQFNDQ